MLNNSTLKCPPISVEVSHLFLHFYISIISLMQVSFKIKKMLSIGYSAHFHILTHFCCCILRYVGPSPCWACGEVEKLKTHKRLKLMPLASLSRHFSSRYTISLYPRHPYSWSKYFFFLKNSYISYVPNQGSPSQY